MIQILCPVCKGTGEKDCLFCKDRSDDDKKKCPECKGTGKVPCDACMGGGIIDTTAMA